MGIFDGIEKADMRYNAENVQPGQYIGRLNAVKSIILPRDKMPAVVIDVLVLHVLQPYTGPDGTPNNKVGSNVAIYFKQGPSFLGNFKTFVAKTLDIDPIHINVAECDRITGGEQPLKDLNVEYAAATKPNKTKPGNFTAVQWRGQVPASRLKELLPAELQARFFPNNYLEQLIEFEAKRAQTARI